MIALLLRVLGRQHAGPVRRAVALMAVAAAAEGASYALLVPLLRALFGPAPADARPWLVAFGGAVAAYAILRYIGDLAGFRAGGTLLRGVYHRLGDHLARLPVGWHTAGRVGEVSVLASRGVLSAMSVIAHLLGPLVSAVVTPAAIAVVMLAVDWRLGVAALAAAPVVALVFQASGRAAAAADTERSAQEREAAARVVEHLQAQPVLRAGGRSGSAFLDGALEGVRHASRKMTLATLPGVIGLAATVQAVFTALLALGAHRALGGGPGAVDVITVLVLAARCADPLLSLAGAGGTVRVARAELARLDAVLSTPPLPEPASPAMPVGADVAFESVGFADVLHGVTLAVPAGQRLAVVGPSGAGKTTLLRLLARFMDVDSGSVRVGGVDVRSVPADELMTRFAIVFQDVFLFDGTIAENVRLGRPDADDAAVRAAASAAGLDEVVARLPAGWNTAVGEGGARLSGGERQRVSIARALLKDAPIVLLDEVTSALDPANEAAVHAGLERLLAGRTVVLVAHRLRTVRHADRIVFLADGRVVEDGTHDELLAMGGRYADHWSLAAAA